MRWARDLAIKLDNEAAYLLGQLKQVINRASDAEVTEEFASEIDPVDVIEQSAFAKTMVEVSTVERAYSIGLWDAWLANFAYSVVYGAGSKKSSGMYARDNTSDLFGKLRKGIAQQCGDADAKRLLDQHVPAAREEAEAEVKKWNAIHEHSADWM